MILKFLKTVSLRNLSEEKEVHLQIRLLKDKKQMSLVKNHCFKSLKKVLILLFSPANMTKSKQTVDCSSAEKSQSSITLKQNSQRYNLAFILMTS